MLAGLRTKASSTELFPLLWEPTTATCGRSRSAVGMPACKQSDGRDIPRSVSGRLHFCRSHLRDKCYAEAIPFACTMQPS